MGLNETLSPNNQGSDFLSLPVYENLDITEEEKLELISRHIPWLENNPQFRITCMCGNCTNITAPEIAAEIKKGSEEGLKRVTEFIETQRTIAEFEEERKQRRRKVLNTISLGLFWKDKKNS